MFIAKNNLLPKTGTWGGEFSRPLWAEDVKRLTFVASYSKVPV